MNYGLISENIHMAIKSVMSSKIRSILTVLGTTIGVFAVITIIAITTGLKSNISSQIISLGADTLEIVPFTSDNAGFASPNQLASFTKSEIKEMRSHQELYVYFSEQYIISSKFEYKAKSKTAFTVGVRPDFFKMNDRKVLSGELFTTQDLKSASNVVVIGSKVSEDFFGTPAQGLGKTLKINGKEFEIIGVMTPQDVKIGGFDIDEAVYIPATTADNKFEHLQIRAVFVKIPDVTKLDESKISWNLVMKEIRGKEDFDVLGSEDLLALVDRVVGILSTALGGLASISLLVGGIGIMNIMLVSVTERTKEIGIRKALGAENKDILIQFLTESIVLAALGGLIGIFLAFIVSFGLKQTLGITSIINLATVSGAIGFSVLVGVIFGTVPALKAAQKDPIEALRYD